MKTTTAKSPRKSATKRTRANAADKAAAKVPEEPVSPPEPVVVAPPPPQPAPEPVPVQMDALPSSPIVTEIPREERLSSADAQFRKDLIKERNLLLVATMISLTVSVASLLHVLGII